MWEAEWGTKPADLIRVVEVRSQVEILDPSHSLHVVEWVNIK